MAKYGVNYYKVEQWINKYPDSEIAKKLNISRERVRQLKIMIRNRKIGEKSGKWRFRIRACSKCGSEFEPTNQFSSTCGCMDYAYSRVKKVKKEMCAST